jgi:hypothetical protein
LAYLLVSHIFDPDSYDLVTYHTHVASDIAYAHRIYYWLAYRSKPKANLWHIADDNLGADNQPDYYPQV